MQSTASARGFLRADTAVAPEDLQRDLDRRSAIANANALGERHVPPPYVRDRLSQVERQWLIYDIEEALAEAGWEDERILGRGEALCKLRACCPEGTSEFVVEAAHKAYRQLVAWGCAKGSYVVITSHKTLAKAIGVSVSTMRRARPLLACLGTPLVVIEHDNGETRGLATILPILPSRGRRKTSHHVSFRTFRTPHKASPSLSNSKVVVTSNGNIELNVVRAQTAAQADAESSTTSQQHSHKSPRDKSRRLPEDAKWQEPTLTELEDLWRRTWRTNPRFSRRKSWPKLRALMDQVDAIKGRGYAMCIAARWIELSARRGQALGAQWYPLPADQLVGNMAYCHKRGWDGIARIGTSAPQSLGFLKPAFRALLDAICDPDREATQLVAGGMPITRLRYEKDYRDRAATESERLLSALWSRGLVSGERETFAESLAEWELWNDFDRVFPTLYADEREAELRELCDQLADVGPMRPWRCGGIRFRVGAR
jgi:hypothetical protein